MTFAHSPRFGWLTFCPTNLGTTIRFRESQKTMKLTWFNIFKDNTDKLE